METPEKKDDIKHEFCFLCKVKGRNFFFLWYYTIIFFNQYTYFLEECIWDQKNLLFAVLESEKVHLKSL